jgi:hypothetical protein
MKKIKIIFDVAGLFLIWGLVFFTAGMMFEGIANYGLYDVLESSAIIFGFGGIGTMWVLKHISDVVYLKTRDDKPEEKDLEEIHDNI